MAITTCLLVLLVFCLNSSLSFPMNEAAPKIKTGDSESTRLSDLIGESDMARDSDSDMSRDSDLEEDSDTSGGRHLTGHYLRGPHVTGDHLRDLLRGDHLTGDHLTEDHLTGDHSPVDHLTDHSIGHHSTGDHLSGHHLSGHHLTGHHLSGHHLPRGHSSEGHRSAVPKSTNHVTSHHGGHKHVEDQDNERYLDKFLDQFLDESVLKDLKRRVHNHERHGPRDSHSHNRHQKSNLAENVEEPLDPYEMMQSDQPAPTGDDGQNGSAPTNDAEYMLAVRNRMKESWLEMLKQNILKNTGHQENSGPKINDTATLERFNYSRVFKVFNNTTYDDQHTNEKIRSYYPSCDPPRNTDEDIWLNETSLNLYFNISPDDSIKIASSFLRLYRLSAGNSSNNGIVPENGCDYSDDKLLRVSVYWYTKALRKNNRSKRRLADSKVISENEKFVELSIRPALKAWAKGRNKNLGLSIEVEDQDVNPLKPKDYFKGASCMVGVSTPKPIPTVFLDAARKTYELDRESGHLDGNSTAPFNNDLSLLPTIDICFTDFPENDSNQDANSDTHHVKACNFLIMQERSRNRDGERDFENKRHIRHSKHQHGLRVDDFLSRMENTTIIIPRHEVLNFTNNNR